MEQEMFWRGGLVNNVGGLIVERRNVYYIYEWRKMVSWKRGGGETLAGYIFGGREMLGA